MSSKSSTEMSSGTLRPASRKVRDAPIAEISFHAVRSPTGSSASTFEPSSQAIRRIPGASLLPTVLGDTTLGAARLPHETSTAPWFLAPLKARSCSLPMSVYRP
jgi:hypothetical protein